MVKSFKTVAAALVVVLWTLATNHCRLEEIPGFSFLVCCDHEGAVPHQDNDCDTDGCASVESGFYKTEDTQVAGVAPALALVIFLLPTLEQDAELPRVLTDFSTVAPPELPKLWQFTFRTALPPRAPSLAS